jgi:hypothetical protein
MPDSTSPAELSLLAGRAQSRGTVMAWAAAQFVVLTVVGMVVYPGGSHYDHHVDHYVFLANFFSDLGATRTQTGASNTLACALFVTALGSVGLALIVFAPAWKFLTGGAGTHNRAGMTSEVMATLAGLCFIGIAAVPHNLDNVLHLKFVKAAFVLLLGFIVPFTYLLYAFRWPKRDVWIGVVYVIALVAYVLNLFVGPSVRTPWGFSFQVVTQKLFVYYSVATVAILALAVRRQAAAHFAQQRRDAAPSPLSPELTA